MAPPLTGIDHHGHHHREGWGQKQESLLCSSVGTQGSQCPPACLESLPATKAVMDEKRGPRPGADSEGMQDRTSRPTDTRPSRAARMLKVCVTRM